MSLGRSINVCTFLKQYKMENYADLKQLTVVDIVQYFDEIFTNILEFPATAIGDLILSKNHSDYSEPTVLELNDYMIRFQKFYECFRSKTIPFLWNCFKKLKNTKNTMHILYNLYSEVNEWLIVTNTERNALVNYVTNECKFAELKPIAGQLTNHHEQVDTQILLLFRAIKLTLIKNDNVFALYDILEDEDEVFEARYIMPHILNSIKHNAPNCFRKLYGLLLSAVDGDMSVNRFSKICLEAHKYKSTQIKRTILRNLSKLGRKYRDLYNNITETMTF